MNPSVSVLNIFEGIDPGFFLVLFILKMGPGGTCFCFSFKIIRGAISILIPTSKILKWTWKKNKKLDLLFQGEKIISGVAGIEPKGKQ